MYVYPILDKKKNFKEIEIIMLYKNNNDYGKFVDAVYSYVTVDDPDETKRRINNVLDFVIRLRHSYVDNDKCVSVSDVNAEILRVAELCDL